MYKLIDTFIYNKVSLIRLSVIGPIPKNWHTEIKKGEQEIGMFASQITDLMIVNWTKFFIMTTPPDMHSYFLADPLVEVPSMRYTKRIDKLLQRTPKRVFTNYVILHYILSWIQYLDDEYRQLMELIDLQHLEFLDLVDKYEYMRGVAMIRKLLDYDPAEDFTPYLNSLLPSPNAFYAPLINMLAKPSAPVGIG
ncbi:hypothetical protein NECAME_16698 [Necator americanus]|uniref:Uncharacterized protein n=1 Tax=Necator americanus TaxID=51031 RepID=W2TV52_NECAM|nr:hypothetical protein NECAME_16698 [Necator americanus]ETN85693.1 hypothetical protein NECAME_16698 [Necator americanus]